MVEQIKPYYEEEGMTIYCRDCLEIMKQIPSKSIDLVLTDPPYGVRKKEKWDNKENFIQQIDNWLNECIRISEIVVWFCAGKMMPCILKGREEIFHRLLIWNKPVGSQFAGAMHNNIWYSLEPILIFGDTKGKGKESQFDYACWEARTEPFKNTLHPTKKPNDLMKYLVNHYSNKNDLVLDPFLGSGTTLVAAKELGRKAIGIEINQKYCDIAIRRIKNTIKNMF